MGKIFSIIFLIFCLGTNATTQKLIDVEQLGSFPKALIELFAGFPVENGVDYYKITYETIGTDGNLDTASGLVVIPLLESTQDLPMVVYQHPTSQGPGDVPTTQGIGFFESLGFGAFGFITISTDYLGLGESRGFHPFIHAATEAQQGIHMMEASLEYFENRSDLSWNEVDLFISGYSQGGHASMALHRVLQEEFSETYSVTAACHMSGPYSLSGAMKEKFTSDEPTIFLGDPAYLLLGYNEVEPFYDSLTQIFKEPYAIEINKFYNREINLDALSGLLGAKLNKLNGNTIIRNMFQDSILTQLSDPESLISNLLKENDTYDWAPTAPTLLLYCSADERVPFENTIIADSVMAANGSTSVTAVDISPSSSHAACFPFAASAAINFFQLNATTTSVKRFAIEKEISIYPNPASGSVYFSNKINEPKNLAFQLLDVTGKVILKRQLNESFIDISTIQSGIYYLQFSGDLIQETHPLIIQK